MHLTKRAIDRFTYSGNAPARDVRWDDAVRGLGVRIYPNGRKAFVLSYRHLRRKRFLTLGAFGVLTLDRARDLARGHLLGVKTEGVDPLEVRERALQGESVADLCQHYLDRYAKPQKRSWADDASRIRNHILPAWGTMKAAALKRMDVAALHRSLGADHPYAANRFLELVSKMFELARLWGMVEETHANPARDIPAFPEQKRERWVTQEEMPRLAQAISEEPNLYARAAIWMYLLTGVRKSELLRARWSDISWERTEWRLPETKNGRPHHIPLTAPALRVLKRLPREDGNPHVFCGALAGHPLVNINKPWNRIRQAADIPDVRLHDLRRTVGSWLAQQNQSLHLIGRVLNHKTASTTQVYARFGENHVRKALTKHGTQLVRAIPRRVTAEILPFRHREK